MKLGYARVSTPSQDLAGQRARLQAAGAARLFEDVASGRASGRAGARRSSGGAVERPGLEALLAQLREGDVVCVVRLDRLGRSLGELLALVERVRAAGAALESLEERIDTGSAAGALVLHVFAALAEFERSLIAERTRDGIAAARARGRRPGRPPADAETLRAALTLVAAGESPTRAARQAGIGRSTLYRALKAGQGA
ncbi:MAG: recombinase family protein [Pseudomonadota bacterium]